MCRAQRLVGGAHIVLGLGQGIGRGLALAFGFLKRVHQLEPPVGEKLRQVGHFGERCAGLVGPPGQRLDLGRGPLRPFLPLRLFGKDCLAPVGAVLRFAFDAVMARACFGIDGALAIDVIAQSGDFLDEPVKRRQFGEFGLGRGQTRLRFGEARFGAALGFIEGARLLQALGDLPLVLAERAARDLQR